MGPVGSAQIAGRLGDADRLANLAGVRSFSGLVPHLDASGLASRDGGPSKAGDACLREALYMAADHARKIDPILAARYHRLLVNGGKHHNSALCTIAAVLLTRIAACLRNREHYQLRDTDGTPITEEQGRAIVAEQYQIPPKVRAARRSSWAPPDSHDGTSGPKKESLRAPRHRPFRSQHEPELAPNQHLTSVNNSLGCGYFATTVHEPSG